MTPPVRSLRSTLLLATVLLGSACIARADAPRATLQKVKHATVYLQVRTPGGAVYEGTGFFADEPGLIVTNAHVLGMLEPNSRKPLQVDVVVNSGEPDSKTYRGQVLGADRGTDLGVVRIQGKGLPEPLKLGTAKDLSETQEVFVFGFPFGKRLGKNITVSKSSISSLRKSAAGAIAKIQVNGGMSPGNSGGPVTDTQGQVIGVAVSAIKNSQINFAIPSDHVRYFLDGRPEYTTREAAYKDGDKIKMPILVHLNDPLSRMKKVAVEVWVGPAGKPRPASAKEPKAMPGDSERQLVILTYDKKGSARGEVTLPALSDPKQVYWLRPVLTNARDETRWISAAGQPLHMLVERKPIQLKYQPAPGKQMFMNLNSNATLRLRDDDGEEHSIRSNMKVLLRELSAKEAPENGGGRFLLKFQSIAAGIFIDNQLVKGNADTKDIFKNTIQLALNVDMDGDGNLTVAKQDMTRVSRDTRDAVSDLGDQVLQSLKVMTTPLSGDALKPLQIWKTQRLLEVGPLGMAVPVQADIRYTFLGVRQRLGKSQAVISMHGGLRGQRGDGSNVAGTVDGTLMVSPETGQIVEGVATLKVDLDLPQKRRAVKANGELVVSLKRSATPPPAPPKKK
ncbi:MAG TPA: serine protease [Gemmataceae bacterium]|nr:serine protease [Gemmataceae bacterium]